MGGNEGVDGRRVQVVAVLVAVAALLLLPLVVATGADWLTGGGMSACGRGAWWATIGVGIVASFVGVVQGWRRESAAGFVPGVVLLVLFTAIAVLVRFP
jgi:hypothetical protein